MTEQLARSGAGPIEVLKGVTQAAYLRWHNEMDEIDAAVESALADRKEKLAAIKAGLGGKDDFAAFKRARKDREMSGEARERRELSYRKQMAWLSKPVGFQPTMDLPAGAPEAVVAFNAGALKRIDHEGETAGAAGRKREENPYTPGTEQAQRWDVAWLRGQARIADSMAPGGGPELRRRGRPPGSRNRPKTDLAESPQEDDSEGSSEEAPALADASDEDHPGHYH